MPRATNAIEALSEFVDAMERYSRRDSTLEELQGRMDLEELEMDEEGDLDADIEDMDDELESSLIEGDSMGL
jgi:hypothetical protein